MNVFSMVQRLEFPDERATLVWGRHDLAVAEPMAEVGVVQF
jgi:hypothetical protein